MGVQQRLALIFMKWQTELPERMSSYKIWNIYISIRATLHVIQAALNYSRFDTTDIS